ncbi:MAG TPA: DUF4249 domain-containing protein [Mucilaginibacter sp.]
MPTKKYPGKVLLLFLLLIVTFSCRKPYDPPLTNGSGSYLVVEGLINSGGDSTIIKLSRTVKISSKTSVNPELNALVEIEGDQNVSYPLTEISDGVYACAGLNLDASHKYRLNIKTTNNKQYLSDYVPVVTSPPIDSVSFDQNGTTSGPGLNIYANTHDANNKARYYRWEYQETWEIHPALESYYKSNGDTVLPRDMVHDNIYNCWQSNKSSVIILGSSAKLTQNVISNSLLVTIPSTSEKLGDQYSILVNQYALTPEAYSFYTNLKKNTEQLGSIFDAQPSEIAGNIHNVSDPSEPVLGYISAGTSTSQRIFIKKGQLIYNWKFTPYYADCKIFFDDHYRIPCCYFSAVAGGITINQVDEYINYNKDGGNTAPLLPLEPISQPGQGIVGYTATIPECADCTLRGSDIKPAFWPQ